MIQATAKALSKTLQEIREMHRDKDLLLVMQSLATGKETIHSGMKVPEGMTGQFLVTVYNMDGSERKGALEQSEMELVPEEEEGPVRDEPAAPPPDVDFQGILNAALGQFRDMHAQSLGMIAEMQKGFEASLRDLTGKLESSYQEQVKAAKAEATDRLEWVKNVNSELSDFTRELWREANPGEAPEHPAKTVMEGLARIADKALPVAEKFLTGRTGGV